MKWHLCMITTLVVDVLSYRMGALITCLEQNDESPYGFRESLTWGNPESLECQEYPDLCVKYMTEEPFAGRGDVCDHTDPRSGRVRNACKMAVMFGQKEDAEKTWSWKCWDLIQCPVKNETGHGTVGCLITEKRIQCCCQEDFCTSNPVYAEYAAYGREDHWPPNMTAILAIDPGNITVVTDIDWDYEYITGNSEESESESSSEETSDSSTSTGTPLDDYPAKKEFGSWIPPSPAISDTNKGIAVADIVLIFTYFVIGTMCISLGVFVGSKWKRNVLKQPLNYAHNI